MLGCINAVVALVALMQVKGPLPQVYSKAGIFSKDYSVVDSLLGVGKGGAGRGFAIDVEKPWTGTREQLLLLGNIHGLREIRFDVEGYKDEWAEAIQQAKGLKGVFLDGCPATDRTLLTLAKLQLEVLSLYGTGVSNTGLGYLSNMKSLRYLLLTSTKVSDSGLKSVGNMAALEYLFLDDTNTTRRGFQHLQRLNRLRQLRLSGRSDGGPEISFSSMRQLEELDARGIGITDKEFRSLCEIPTLVSLVVSWSRITDGGLQYLRPDSKLVNLKLNSSGITNKGVSHLARLPELKYLDLSETSIDDESIPALLRIPSLKVLSISGSRISEKGEENLRKHGLRLPR